MNKKLLFAKCSLLKHIKKEFFMYKRLLIFTFCVIGLAVVLSLLPVHGETEVYDAVVRLHVLANSDSEADQELKLKVRDAILGQASELFENCASKEEAERKISENLERIESIARSVIEENGYNYSVRAVLGEEDYPTRNYESCCFPSGEYTSLQILRGDAEGQNWWCVLFPPLCLNAATDGDGFAQVGLSGEQYNLITQTEKPKYKARFKILETIESTFG